MCNLWLMDKNMQNHQSGPSLLAPLCPQNCDTFGETHIFEQREQLVDIQCYGLKLYHFSLL